MKTVLTALILLIYLQTSAQVFKTAPLEFHFNQDSVTILHDSIPIFEHKAIYKDGVYIVTEDRTNVIYRIKKDSLYITVNQDGKIINEIIYKKD